MAKETYLKSLKIRKKTVIWITIITVVLALILSLVQPLEYRASGQLLVIQKQTGGFDAYTRAKSAEKIANDLAEIIYTSSFMDNVLASGFNINQQRFSSREDKKRKQWKNKIDVLVAPNSGLIKLNVYDKDKGQAAQIAQGIIFVLTTKSEQYHGGGKEIEIKTVDSPIVSNYPVRPNILVNVILGLVLGLFLSGIYVYLKPAPETLTKNLEEIKVSSKQTEKDFQRDFSQKVDFKNAFDNGYSKIKQSNEIEENDLESGDSFKDIGQSYPLI